MCQARFNRPTYDAITAVLAAYPDLFGPDRAEQRPQWESELLWATTVSESRSYGGRYGDGPTIVPLLDCHNHINNGPTNSIVIAMPDANDPNRATIWGFGKQAELNYAQVWPHNYAYCHAFLLTLCISLIG